MAAITGKFNSPAPGQGRSISSFRGITSNGVSTAGDLPHQYWRLRLLSNNGSNYPAIQELRFIGADFATELGYASTDGDPLSSSYVAPPIQAFDDDQYTDWEGSSSVSIGSSYLGFRFTSPVEVTGFRLVQNVYYSYLITGVQLEYSDDGSTWFAKGDSSSLALYAATYTSYQQLDVVMLVGAGVAALNTSLPALTSDGLCVNEADLIHTDAAGVSLPMLEIDAGIYGITQSLPALTINADSDVSQTVSIGAITLPEITGSGEVLVGGRLAGSITLPSLSCEGSDIIGVNASLPALLGEATCVQHGYGEIASSLAILTIEASGTTENSAAADINLPALLVASDSLLGQVGSVNVEMAKLVLAAEGLTGTISTVAVSLPLVVVGASSIHDTTATVEIELPVLVLEATTPEAALSVAGAYVLNLSNGALTEFAFAHNSMAVFNGQIVVASASGLFLLAGTSDNSSPINASARLPLGDMGVSNLKRISTAYVGYRSNGELSFTVAADDGDEYSYLLENTGAPGAFGGRAKCGRGLNSRYLAIGIDSDGATMEVSDIELEVEILSKKAG